MKRRAVILGFLWLVTLSWGKAEGRTPCQAGWQTLGSHYSGKRKALDFRVYSEHATKVLVEIFDQARGSDPVLTLPMQKNASNVWEVSVPASELQRVGLMGGNAKKIDRFIYYGYRAWGPNWPEGTPVGSDLDAEGNRFNPRKLLLDPYGQRVSHDPVHPDMLDGSLYATGPHKEKDSGKHAPKSVVLGEPRAPRVRPFHRGLQNEVIYELHVRGFTMLAPHVVAPGISDADKGTLEGLRKAIPYLKELGVTAVELMPLHEFPDGTNDPNDTRKTNSWGYNTTNFFSPNSRYVSESGRSTPDGEREEFQRMVDDLNAAGINVIMDVVFNHTAEMGAGGANGEETALHSFRGLDNQVYYQNAADRRFFVNNNGVGANLNVAHPVVRDMVLDSLKYWASLGVAGFRFDLAPVLLNSRKSGEDGFHYDKMDLHNIANRAVKELPNTYLIAEPWGAAGDTYRVGEFPTGWAEWNGKFRDMVRRTVSNKSGQNMVTPSEVAVRVAGSQDLYWDNFDGRKPYHSVNFFTAHDGFTAYDLTAYNQKQNNQPAPFGPSDGGEDHNNSWDHQLPGETAEQTEARRRQSIRTMQAITGLSFGTPMLLAGDEIHRTQRGNNNMYNVDSKGSWVNWPENVYDLPAFRFVKNLLAFRKAHPAVRPAEYANGQAGPSGLRDLAWYQADGTSAEDRDLSDDKKGYMSSERAGFLAWRIDAEKAKSPDGVRSIYMAYNWSPDTKAIKLPPPAPGKRWYWAADTDRRFEANGNFRESGKEVELTSVFAPVNGVDYELSGGAFLVLVEK